MKRAEMFLSYKHMLDTRAFYSEELEAEKMEEHEPRSWARANYDPADNIVFLSFQWPIEELSMTPVEAEAFAKSILLAVEHAEKMRGGS